MSQQLSSRFPIDRSSLLWMLVVCQCVAELRALFSIFSRASLSAKLKILSPEAGWSSMLGINLPLLDAQYYRPVFNRLPYCTNLLPFRGILLSGFGRMFSIIDQCPGDWVLQPHTSHALQNKSLNCSILYLINTSNLTRLRALYIWTCGVIQEYYSLF